MTVSTTTRPPTARARARFVLELEAAPDDVPAVARLKAALKHLWRVHKLRCRTVTEVIGRPPAGRDGENTGLTTERLSSK
jgi:hypothetical protein